MLEDERLLAVDESVFREELLEIMKSVERDYEQLAAQQKPALRNLLEANRNLKNADLGINRLVAIHPRTAHTQFHNLSFSERDAAGFRANFWVTRPRR